jgi:hypothetical protein
MQRVEGFGEAIGKVSGGLGGLKAGHAVDFHALSLKNGRHPGQA